MRMVLQVLGGVWLVSMLLTISSCLYIGHVVTTAAHDMPARSAWSSRPADTSAAVDEAVSRYRSDYRARQTYSPSVPTATYTPGQPMIDPTPPGGHHYR